MEVEDDFGLLLKKGVVEATAAAFRVVIADVLGDVVARRGSGSMGRGATRLGVVKASRGGVDFRMGSRGLASAASAVARAAVRSSCPRASCEMRSSCPRASCAARSVASSGPRRNMAQSRAGHAEMQRGQGSARARVKRRRKGRRSARGAALGRGSLVS